MSPLGTVPFNPAVKDMPGWAGETTLDVQIIHAIAPDAGIVVLTSPVDKTEGYYWSTPISATRTVCNYKSPRQHHFTKLWSIRGHTQ